MTRLDVIQMIGDVITEVDVARGSLMPNDPSRDKLDDLRIAVTSLLTTVAPFV